MQTIIGVAGLQFTQTPTVAPSFVTASRKHQPATTSTAVHTSPSPSPSPSVQPVQPKLTTKAEIGLGVGVVIGALLLFAMAYCFWPRKTGRKPVAGLWTRKTPSLDATPQPNQPPINTPYIPERLMSPPPTSEASEGSRHDLPPGQGFAQTRYQSQMDGLPFEVYRGMRREDGNF